MSPGTVSDNGCGRAGPLITVVRPSRRIETPAAARMRSVWSRVGPAASMTVSPSAPSAARDVAAMSCALATGNVCVTAASRSRPVTVIGACPSVVVTSAPTARRSVATGSIGLARREASPSRVTRSGSPATAPARRRIVVPELPQSSTASCDGLPEMEKRTWSPLASGETVTPRARRQAAVLRTSAPGDRSTTSAGPPESAATMSARCAIDLSPGGASVPRSRAAGRTARGVAMDIRPCRPRRRARHPGRSTARGDVAPTAMRGARRRRPS